MGATRNEPKEFALWWNSQFWADAFDDDDRETALAGWKAANTRHAPTDEKLILLRKLCDQAEAEGWQHIATTTLRAILG